MLKLSYRLLISILCLLILTSAVPFIYYAFNFHPHKYLILLCSVAIFVLVYFKENKFKINTTSQVLLFSAVSVWSIGLLNFDALSITLLTHLVVITTVLIALNDHSTVRLFAKLWVSLAILISILTVISFILLLFNFIEPVALFPRPNDAENVMIYRVGFVFSNSPFYWDGTLYARLAGHFDEPGQYAMFIVHSFFISYVTGFSDKTRVLLLVAGLVTTSLAFILTIPMLLMFMYSSRGTVCANNKSFKFAQRSKIAGIFVIISSVLAIINTSNDGNLTGIFDDVVFERIQNFEHLSSGGNRSASFSAGLEALKDSPLLGVGRHKFIKEFGDPGSLLGQAGIVGVLGLILLLIPWFIIFAVAISRRSISVLIMALILFINYIHRPPSIGLYNYVLMYMLIFTALEISSLNSLIKYNLNHLLSNQKSLYGKLKTKFMQSAR